MITIKCNRGQAPLSSNTMTLCQGPPVWELSVEQLPISTASVVDADYEYYIGIVSQKTTIPSGILRSYSVKVGKKD